MGDPSLSQSKHNQWPVVPHTSHRHQLPAPGPHTRSHRRHVTRDTLSPLHYNTPLASAGFHHFLPGPHPCILASSLPAPPECVKRDNVCVLPWFCVSAASWAGCWSDAGTGKYAYQIGGYCFIDNNVQYIYTIPSMYLLFYLNS